MCKPKGQSKHLVTDANLFKDAQFRALVSQAIKELEKYILMEIQNLWSRFYKQIQGAIK